MLRSRSRIALLAAAVLAAACQPEEKSTQVTVMTRNLNLGCDVNTLIGTVLAVEEGLAPPAAVPPAVDAAWAELQATDFPARAKVVAAEIASTHPDVVGLQEVSLWRTGPVPTTSPPPLATTVAYDFLQLLVAELLSQGLDYQVASQVQNFDGQLPKTDGTLVRMTDRDAILVRAGVAWSNPTGGNYATRVPLTSATGPFGVQLDILRGWTSVQIEKDGVRFAVFETHLEEELRDPPLYLFQAGQAGELAALLTNERLPVILVGDLNSNDPAAPTTTYDLLLGLGLGDPWEAFHPSDPGYSCCIEDPLLQAPNPLTMRIDHTMYSGVFTPQSTSAVPLQKTPATTAAPTGIYPSDHQAVVSTFAIKVPGAR